MNKESGYTLIEVAIVLAFVGVAVVLGFGVYVGLHFIFKFW